MFPKCFLFNPNGHKSFQMCSQFLYLVFFFFLATVLPCLLWWDQLVSTWLCKLHWIAFGCDLIMWFDLQIWIDWWLNSTIRDLSFKKVSSFLHSVITWLQQFPACTLSLFCDLSFRPARSPRARSPCRQSSGRRRGPMPKGMKWKRLARLKVGRAPQRRRRQSWRIKSPDDLRARAPPRDEPSNIRADMKGV